MKSEYSAKVERLDAKVNASNDDPLDIKGLLDKESAKTGLFNATA